MCLCNVSFYVLVVLFVFFLYKLNIFHVCPFVRSLTLDGLHKYVLMTELFFKKKKEEENNQQFYTHFLYKHTNILCIGWLADWVADVRCGYSLPSWSLDYCPFFFSCFVMCIFSLFVFLFRKVKCCRMLYAVTVC